MQLLMDRWDSPAPQAVQPVGALLPIGPDKRECALPRLYSSACSNFANSRLISLYFGAAAFLPTVLAPPPVPTRGHPSQSAFAPVLSYCRYVNHRNHGARIVSELKKIARQLPRSAELLLAAACL